MTRNNLIEGGLKQMLSVATSAEYVPVYLSMFSEGT
jgi:hypothetical protein